VSTTCHCGPEGAAPTPPSNRPGLSTLAYRIGTHASFLAGMKASAATFVPGGHRPGRADAPPLARLDPRNVDDPAMALLDVCAVMADILAFYQERIANEGYLRTATEASSIAALAAQVGYSPKPGVAASVHLAYDVQDAASDAEVVIAAGSVAQSTPEAGAPPQTFETSGDLRARRSWTRLPVRASMRQASSWTDPGTLFLAGTATGLKPNDPLLVLRAGKPVFDAPPLVASVEPDFAADRTKVTLQSPAAAAADPSGGAAPAAPVKAPAIPLDQLLAQVASAPARRPGVPPAAAGTLRREGSDAALRFMTLSDPAALRRLYTALENVPIDTSNDIEVRAFRVRAAPFGNNAPLKPVQDRAGRIQGYEEWTLRRDPAPAGGAEKCVVRLTLATSSQTQGDKSFFDITAVIGDHPACKGRLPPAGGNVQIVDAAADEVIDVSLDWTPPADWLVVKLVRRAVELRIAFADPGLSITAGGGADPVAVRGFVTQTEDRIESFRALASAMRDGAGSESVLEFEADVIAPAGDQVATEVPGVISLDATYEQVMPGTFALVRRPDADPAKGMRTIVTRIADVAIASRADYGITGRTTRLTLDTPWLGDVAGEDFAKVIRGTTIHAQSETLPLATQPVAADVEGSEIVLDGVFGGLPTGRLLIVAGERADALTPGEQRAELVVLADSVHVPDSDGQVRTRLRLVDPLQFKYRVGGFAVFGNVVHATHGETRRETLGDGDASQPALEFALRQGPLTYVSAASADGTASTLQVTVNDVRWHEAPSFTGLGPTDRCYVTHPLDGGRVEVVFGDGINGARTPTGQGNVKAVYRSGLGVPGNVPARKLNQAISKPLGVNGVSNPMEASGGADPEAPEGQRRNAPIAAMALDRLVSASDYADFARAFAGVGKAVAVRLAASGRESVCLTLTGADETPLLPSSDVCTNLAAAATNVGDPHEPLLVLAAEASLLALSARVRLAPDYSWDSVRAAIVAALIAEFGYASRDFGQDLVLSQVISAMQRVPGVRDVAVDLFAGRSAASVSDPTREPGPPQRPRPGDRLRALPARLGARVQGRRPVLPARIVFMTARPALVAELVSLTEQTS